MSHPVHIVFNQITISFLFGSHICRGNQCAKHGQTSIRPVCDLSWPHKNFRLSIVLRRQRRGSEKNTRRGLKIQRHTSRIVYLKNLISPFIFRRLASRTSATQHQLWTSSRAVQFVCVPGKQIFVNHGRSKFNNCDSVPENHHHRLQVLCCAVLDDCSCRG